MTVQAATDALNGVDTNNNGSVDPVPGEGGAQTAYLHSQLMAQYNLVETGAVPAAGEVPQLPRSGGAEVPVVWIALGIALLAGALEVAQLPDAWDAAYERVLGVRASGPSQGVPQDVPRSEALWVGNRRTSRGPS